MKKTAIVALLGILMFSCKNEKKEGQNIQTDTVENTKEQAVSKDINWNEIPDLKDIGNFPFFTAPAGLKISDEKEGLSEFFDYETMQNYTGSSIYTSEGKLGILSFEGADGKDFNQKLFDKSYYDYLDKIGAKQIYKGEFPEDEKQRAALEKNSWNGKKRTSGLLRESDSPFAVYAFKNGGKKYIVNIQSNSAQGNIFIMELKNFEQTIKKYSAAQMKTDIDKTGKAILHINFDTDKASLQEDGQEIVDEIAALLNADPKLKLSIEGHTDNSGTETRNQALSTQRANTVMYALAAKGIDIQRLKAKGFGSSKPLKANDTEENKAENRRVELVKIQ
ncbi:OmpA family protein [Flavobacterium aquidurense]|uniref:OmpA/MotB domain protein n=1 Tax=Flavobacterium aquidurense TaxID=362413 RepID=A0A0Q1BP03_9FLAO|nr:OmpA family protein [Flavobacterium aquidurense]KQB42637.1 OmpA/MotB domain protein [Flavobacterium aquidurense]